jgi:hypothetical protein
MSFINNAHPGSQINLLCLIYRILYQNPNKFTVDELQSYCAPESLFSAEDHKKRFKETLSFWLTSPHQLWSTNEHDKLVLNLPTYSSGFESAEVAHQLRHRLMQIEFSNILEEVDEFGASKAIRSFAYILTQDQYIIFKNELTRNNIDLSFANNFGNYSLNDSEKSYFIEFCNFLGISERVGSKEHLDPTRLVKSFLGEIFEASKVLKASDFVNQLSMSIPIIDYGEHNLSVREVIGAEVDMPNTLSVNLSHALNRLSEERILTFTELSDDVDSVILHLPNGATKQISSVEYIGGSY